MTAGPSDEEAIRQVLAGDADAFRVLVDRYQARAYRRALSILRNEEAARDAVQESFLKAYTALHKFEGRSRFFTWLYRLVTNQCLDLKRRDRSDRHVEWEEGTTVETEMSDEPTPEVAGVEFAPAASVMQSQLRQQLTQAIEKLPDAPRETLLLREVEGLSYAEIAKALEIPKGTVMSRLYYARQQLQKLLLEAGVAQPEPADEETT